MSAPSVDDVAADPVLPSRAEVVVVGGGIVGVSTALALAEKGIPTALCEKGRIGGEQSSRNWGWCRNTGRDLREVPLMAHSARIWQDLNTRTGRETGYRRRGILFLCQDAEEAARMEGWHRNAMPHQLGTRFLSGQQVADLLPQSERRWTAGLHTPSDGQAEPARAAPAIAEAARARGASIHTRCAVRGIETTAGRVSAVVTERGSIRCDAVVLAGGAWSSLFLGQHELRLPQWKILASVLRTAPAANGPDLAAGGAGFGFRKRLDGGYTIANLGGEVADIVPDTLRFLPDFAATALAHWRRTRPRVSRRGLQEARLPRRWKLDEPSPFEATRVLDPTPHLPGLRAAQKALADAMPFFHDLRPVQSWGGMIDVTPDLIPVMSDVARMPGLFVATGFSGHGFGLGPGAGQLMADLVAGDTPIMDPAAFRFARFQERPRPQPSATAL